VGRLRELSSGRADVGIVLNLFGVHAADGAAPAVERAVERIDLMQNQVWLDALLHGTYGDAVRELAPPAFAELVHDGDLQVIAAPLDWLGVNYYADLEFEQSAHQPAPVSGAPARDAHTAGSYPGADGVVAVDPGPEGTTMRWPVTPSGLTATLQRLARDWPAPPLVVTENGAAFTDQTASIDGDVVVDDPRRSDYLRQHVAAVREAMTRGVDVRGYFAWSLLDNFEWAWGYTQTFGIVHVDPATQSRTPKASFRAYADLVQAARNRA
jgi:beta-glucosidase